LPLRLQPMSILPFCERLQAGVLSRNATLQAKRRKTVTKDM
jgi:hypothetical protein